MSVRSLSKRGFQQLFVIVFIHVGSRRLFVTPSPANLCAFVERVIQMIRVEALDHFVVFGQRHLDHIISVFAAFYNERRRLDRKTT
jgi:putative transposase